MSHTESGSIAIGECVFDTSRGLLLRQGHPVKLRPKTFALLSHLVGKTGHVVSKSELMESVWPGLFVTEDSLTQGVRELRKALRDDSQSIIRTVSGRGYLLSPLRAPARPPSDLPSVAVLRFTNEGDATDTPLVDGFAEDIVNALAGFRTAVVLARNSSFSFASEDPGNWTEVGRRLGATFLVRGRMGLRDGTVRVAINLIEAANGAVLWGEKFTASGSAVFDMQEEIALRVTNRLVARLDDAGLTRARPKPPASLAAYELLLKGLVHLRGYGADDNQAARNYFAAAVTKDTHYALARSYLAFADLIIGDYGMAPPEVLADIVEQARFAVGLAPEEPRCHRILAQALLCTRTYDAAERHFRRSYDLNPFDADTIAQIGYLLAIRGKPFEALTWIDKAVQINPIHPDWYHSDRAFAQYAAGDYKGAVVSWSMLPMTSAVRLTWLAAAQAKLGNQDAVSRLVSELKLIAPSYTPLESIRASMLYEHESDADHLLDGVAKALMMWSAA